MCISSTAQFLIRLLGFLLLLLSCVSALLVLDINPSSDKWFANISSCYIGCLFISFIVSSAVRQLFSLMESHSFIFVFVASVKNS